MIDKFNNSHSIREIQSGTYAMADGPVAEVTRRTTYGAYELKDATGGILPRHYAPEQLSVVTQDLDQPSDESYKVESILGHLTEDGKVLYRVHRKRYEEDEDSYIPYEKFDCDKLVHQYWKSINKTNPHVVAKQHRKTLKTQKEELKRHLARTKSVADSKKQKTPENASSEVTDDRSS
ncbi:hypothetical protein EDD21DRAFT_406271 [Dissophora ornata]|nr:hypothetical protein EDD21DRAFT_406271 [Dissophora ornata]